MSFGISGEHSSATDIFQSIINSIQQSSQNQQQTSTVNRNLTPQQQGVMQPMSSAIMKMFSDPSKFVAPMQHQAREQVNQDYAGFGDKVRQNAYGNGGGGETGKFGMATTQADLARRGQLAGVDNQAAVEASQIPFTAANLAQQFLGMNFGQTATSQSQGNTTTTGQTTENSTDKKTGTKIGVGASTKLF